MTMLFCQDIGHWKKKPISLILKYKNVSLFEENILQLNHICNLKFETLRPSILNIYIHCQASVLGYNECKDYGKS